MTRKAPKDWQCNECGRRMTAAAAERAYMGDGCPGCGGADFEPTYGHPRPPASASQEPS